MDRPLLLPVLALCVGIGLDAAWQPAAGPALTLAVLTLVAWLALPRGRAWLLPVALVAAGLWHHAAWRLPGPLHLVERTGPEPRLASIRGTVLSAERAFPDPERPDGRLAWRGVLAVTTWRPGGMEWEPAEGQIRWSVADGTGLDGIAGAGAEVELDGVLAEPSGPALPGAFSPRDFFAARGWWRELRVESASDVRIRRPSRVGWEDRFQVWAQAALARGLPDDEASRLIRAQALGWRPGLTPELATPFLRAGTLHVFAISGLHIALVAALGVQVLRMAGLGRARAAWVVVPLAWAYVAATGWQASAVRSAVMASVVAAGWVLRRPADLPNSLAAAAGLILVVDPSQLLQPGFQLSFAVVGGMAWWTAPISRWLLERLAFDPWVAESHWTWWRRRLEPLRHPGCVHLGASMAAWLASLPFVVEHFHLVSPISLLANLAVVPLSSLCLAANAASLACAPAWVGLSEWFNQSAWVWMQGMLAVSRWAAAVPGGHAYVRSPGWIWWALPVLGLAVWIRWQPRRPWVWGAATGYAVAALLMAVESWRENRMVLSAGGELFWWEGRGEELLINCGPRGFAGKVAVPWLRTRGVDRLDAALWGVSENRFTGGREELVQELGPSRIGSVPSVRVPKGSREREGKESVVAGWRHGVWEVLWPREEGGRRGTADAQSVVLVGELRGRRCLVIPALGSEGQRALVEAVGTGLRADLVLAGVPSHGEPLGSELLAMIQPRTVVVGCSVRGSHRLSPAARRRLRAGPWEVWFTDEDGSWGE